MVEEKDNRKFNRRPLIAEVHYLSDSPLLQARISDISLGGIFIDTVNALDLGATVKFKFSLPRGDAEEVIEGEGKVTWRQETVGMGLQFTRMRREDWEKIKAYLSELEG